MLKEAKLPVGQQKSPIKTLWLIILCQLSCLIFLLLQGGKLAFMLFIIVVILSIYLMLGKWSGISSSKGTRVLPQILSNGRDIEAGTSLFVKIKVQVPGFWPLPYVIVKDSVMRRQGENYLFEATFVPDWKRRGEISYQTPALRRGFYHFGSSECSTEDIFGLFEHKGSLQLDHSFRVLPQTVNIKEWKQLDQIIKGAHQESAAGRASRETTQINGIREYVYGDRISRIHWKTTARTGTWKSKEFERESLPKIMMVLDRNKQSYQDEEHFERAVSITASLLKYGMRKNLALGLLSIGKETALFEAKHGQEHQKAIMNHLVEVAADGAYEQLEVLHHHIPYFSAGMFLLLITPNDSMKLLKCMNWLKQNNMISCHMWVAAGQEKIEQKNGVFKGNYGYAIQSLKDLPQVLGGRSK